MGVGIPSLSFVAVGDVYLDRPDPASAFQHFADLIRAGDVAFCNLEGPCSDLGTPTIGKWITIAMRPAVIPALAEVGFDVAAVANNHALDYGHEAFLDTLERLEVAGIAGVGGGSNLAQAQRRVILERNGLRLGCLAYAVTIPWGYEATADRPGIAPVRVQTFYEPTRFGYYIMAEQPGMPAKVVNVINPADLAVLQEQVRQTKEDADAVVVSFHWGVAFLPDPAPYQPELAHAVVEAGADLVVGHHAHILQGVEVYQGVPIFYSLSDFVFDYDDDRMDHRETVLLTALFGPEGLVRAAIRPAVISSHEEPCPARPSEYESFKACLESLSTGMNSRFEWDRDEIEITAA